MGRYQQLTDSDRYQRLAGAGRCFFFWPMRADINGLPMRVALSVFLSGPVPELSDRYHAQPERIPYIVTLIHYPLPEVQ